MEKRFSKHNSKHNLNFLDQFSSKRIKQQLLSWLFKKEQSDPTKTIYPWWQVMCLTGVDYFSTLGYQPGIAALVAGDLAPIATIILVLLTLFGALPIYKRVAMRSPHGQGSIAILEKLLSWWQGKLLVLCLLGFVATDFIITITLSASDATAHLVENPWISHLVHGHNVPVALLLIALLGVVFIRGFQEAIKISVFLVVVYLMLNGITITVAFAHILQQPELIIHWKTALFTRHRNPLVMVVIACLVFPKIALGLSGFETGVVVMPLVEGSRYDTLGNPRGRIRNTYKLLQTAAIIMSGFLITSSLVTTWLIPPRSLGFGRRC